MEQKSEDIFGRLDSLRNQTKLFSVLNNLSSPAVLTIIFHSEQDGAVQKDRSGILFTEEIIETSS